MHECDPLSKKISTTHCLKLSPLKIKWVYLCSYQKKNDKRFIYAFK